MSAEGTEKVEMEAVPLKSDTDASPAAAEGAGEAPVEAPVKKEAPKKTWLFGSSKNKETGVEEGGERREEKGKKRGFWQCAKKGTAEERAPNGEAGQMSIGIDMVERDSKGINDHVKLHFEDIFAEPESFHSWDCVWRLVFRVFEWTRVFFYRLFALLFVLPASILFAILFALATALNVFFVVPAAKLLSIPLSWLAAAWAFVVAAVLNPLTGSLANICSKIHVRKYGMNSEPTDLIAA